MRKLVLLALVALVSIPFYAAERTVWAGNQPISWNQEVYEGSQYELANVPGLTAGDILRVYVTPGIENPGYVITYKAGSGWSWTDLSVSESEGVLSCVIANSSEASDIADRGLIFRGQGYNITRVAIADPATRKEVWSSGVEVINLDTKGETYNYLANIRQGYTVKVYTEALLEYVSYQMQDKEGSGWSWTTLPITVGEGYITYTVETREKAEWIRDRGLVINGYGYAAKAIAVETARNSVIWEGSKEFTGSWEWLNGECELTEVSRLAAGDKIVVHVSATSGDDRQVKLLYKDGDDASHDVAHTSLDNEGEQTVEFTLTSDDVTNYQSNANGIILTGCGYTASQIVLQKADKTITDEIVWRETGKQISWNNEYYPGGNFETNDGTTIYADLSGVQAGSVIRARVTAGLNNPQYKLQYKAGANWDWTELVATTTLTANEGQTREITYTVEEDKAAEIANAGLVFQGQGYNIDAISIEVPSSDLSISDADPSESLARLKGLAAPVDVTINRTLYRDGYFNTLCLPFDLSAAQIAETDLAGAEIMAFTNAYISGTGEEQTLDLRFDATDAIVAGTPYLIRFADYGDQLTSLSFSGVTVTKDPSDAETVVEGNSMNFVGIIAPKALSSANNLFLGGENSLYWQNAGDDTSLQGFRAYFVVPGTGGHNGIRARIVTRNNATTDIDETVNRQSSNRKLIKDGRLFIIRDGKLYNAQGQSIQ